MTHPVRSTMCATCPFRPNSPYAYLQDTLTLASTESARICHSTGPANAVNPKPGKPARICRGSRDFQLQLMFALRVIDSPTDEAWQRAWRGVLKQKEAIKSLHKPKSKR